MKNNRQNLDLYFLGYKRVSRTKYILPLIFAIAFAAIGLLIYYQVIPNLLHEAYSYVLFSMGGILLLITILGFLFGRDRTVIPTTVQVNNFLAEDVASVKETMTGQTAPDFFRQDTKEFIVINHCHAPVDGFTPYFKKDEDNVLHCSLNKITIFTFAPKRMQIFTSIVDLFTGIEIRQNSIKLPYSNIYDCYIAYASRIKPETVRYDENTDSRNPQLPAKLVQAVKACQEILRVKTRLKDDYDEQNTIINTYDIMVADFEIYHTTSGVFKNIYTINNGKAIEREVLRRIGNGYVENADEFRDEEDGANFHFVDDFPSGVGKINWN